MEWNADIIEICLARERIDDVFVQMQPLLSAHFEEVKDQFDVPMKIDLDQYRRIEHLGMLKIFTARCLGELVGYNVFITGNHPHCAEMKVANLNLLYIKKSHRGFGKEFVAWCDEELFRGGIDVIIQAHKPEISFIDALKDLGYVSKEVNLIRRNPQWLNTQH